MPKPSGVPAFGGYVAVPNARGNADLLAWWTDGSAAVGFPTHYAHGASFVRWQKVNAPDFAALFPDRVRRPDTGPFTADPRVTRTGFDMTPQDKVAEMARNIPLPFRSDLPAPPRPDDADDREYPVRGGRDD